MDTGVSSREEVDVTEDIEALIKYVNKKKEDDPHDSVLSRIASRLKDISEKFTIETPTTSQPTTPTVTIPDAPQFKLVRTTRGRIVKRKVEPGKAS